jgi:hypothetical protein
MEPLGVCGPLMELFICGQTVYRGLKLRIHLRSPENRTQTRGYPTDPLKYFAAPKWPDVLRDYFNFGSWDNDAELGQLGREIGSWDNFFVQFFHKQHGSMVQERNWELMYQVGSGVNLLRLCDVSGRLWGELAATMLFPHRGSVVAAFTSCLCFLSLLG